MVHGTSYGATYVMEFDKQFNWFDVFLDVMKLTQTLCPFPHDSITNFPLIQKVKITDFISPNDFQDPTLKKLFYDIIKKDNEYNIMNIKNVEDLEKKYKDYDEEYKKYIKENSDKLNAINEKSQKIEQIESLLNSESNYEPFVLSDTQKQTIDFVCKYCSENDIQIVKKGWKFESRCW